jgi:hypothetical protein
MITTGEGNHERSCEDRRKQKEFCGSFSLLLFAGRVLLTPVEVNEVVAGGGELPSGGFV